MHRLVLPLLLAGLTLSQTSAEVTVVSSDVASEIAAAPDREFPCETLPWVDPDTSLPSLVFYRVVGATGPIRVARSAGSALVTGTTPPAAAPESGGTLEEQSLWGSTRFQSGTSIGRALTPELSGAVLLRDVDGSIDQYFDHDPITLGLQLQGGECLEADGAGVSAVACSGAARQRWIVDREGRLRTNTCEGPWSCLVTPNLAAAAAPRAQACAGATAQPDERWAVAHWNDPVDSASLRAGIGALKLPYTYWPMAAVEGTAVPLVLADGGQPIVVVGSAGQGRVAGFGTWQSLCGTTSNGSFETLLDRLTKWAGRSASPVVGLSPQAMSQQSCFNQLGFTTVAATPATLSGVDVYIMHGGDDGAPADDLAHLEEFLRGGGGIMAAHHAFFYWEVQQYPPTDNLLAATLARAGVAWGEDVDEAANAGSTLSLFSLAPSRKSYQVTAAFEAFTRDLLGIDSLTANELATIETNMPLAVTARALMTDVSPFTVAQRALKRLSGALVIGPDQPYTWDQDATRDMALRGDYLLAEALPADRTPAHESTALFPGTVGPGAPRLTRLVTIDGTVPSTTHSMWRGTGLYAPAGEPITVHFPPGVPGAGVFLQIGASFDNVMQYVGFLEPATIGRFPWVTAGRLVQGEEVELTAAFGGPILISIPAGATLGEFEVEIEGAVDEGDAPLVELEGENVILSVRAETVEASPDPLGALQQLDAMIAAEQELVGIDSDQVGSEALPQRLVFDPFEVWGAHSGYPVHMTQSWDTDLLDATIWPGGSGLWGFMHEFGHNHQQPMWTLNHHGEVTCNILAVYAFETVLALPMSQAWDGNLEPQTMAMRTQNWLDSGQPYSSQGYDVALYFFLYVKEAFGWEPFETMYAGYRALPPGQRPVTEQQKIDQLLVRLSGATGRNLTDWFLTFRFPVSQSAIDDVAHLPPWDDAPF